MELDRYRNNECLATMTLNAFTLDKLIDKRMNSERKLTLLMERATERIGWEAPANSDTTTREACRAERSGRSGAFTERASGVKRRNQKVESDIQMIHTPKGNARVNGLVFAQVIEADGTASGFGGGS